MNEVSIITGANGFIGKHLTKALKDKDIEVIPLHHSDLLFPATLQKNLKELKPDYIFHLSAYGNHADQTDLDTIVNANIIGTFNLLKASVGVNYKAFINVSSSSVTLPHQTIYSATKMGGEYLCKAFVDEYDKPIVSIRPYSVYGIGEAMHRFIPTVFRSCLNGEEMMLAPHPVHDWIYVDELVTMLVNNSKVAEIIKGKTLECGTGKATTNQQIVEMIEKITGKKANYKIMNKLREFDTVDPKIWVADYPFDTFWPLQKGLQTIYDSIEE